MYAAWNEAYEHWGVIPTLKPALPQLYNPTDFSRQFFDEAEFWLRNRLQIDLESPWPADVAFPFRAADGRRAVRTVDGRFLCESREISRTVTGVGQLATAGTIPGWRAYDDQRLLGLDPERWYPFFGEPRDANAFYVAVLPDDVICEAVVTRDELAVFRSRSREIVVADLIARMDNAACGSRPFDGPPSQWIGPGMAEGGGSFQDQGDGVLAAHPPWKPRQSEPRSPAGRVWPTPDSGWICPPHHNCAWSARSAWHAGPCRRTDRTA